MTEFSSEELQAQAGAVEPHEVAAALEAICNSDDFKRSSRLTDLLRYIVTEEVADRGPRLKAYSIATEVLGRKADFDPSSDSIVRVEMARLRIALKLYYASTEAPPLVIDVPKGRYRPVFLRTAETSPAPARPVARRVEAPVTPEPAGPAVPLRPVPVWRRAISPVMLFACFIMVAGMMMGTILLMSQPNEAGERLPPLVLVAPVRIASSDAQITGLGLTLQGFLVSEIAGDPVLAVGFLGDERQDLTRNARENRALYLLSVSIVTDNERWSVSANLQDARNRTVLWSRSQSIPAATADNLAWAYDLSQQMAAGIGDPFGAVSRTELAKSSDRMPPTRECVIWMRQMITTWTEDGFRRFVDCTTRLQNSRESETALGLALMSRGHYVAARWMGDPDRTQRLEAAGRLLTRAQALEPQAYLVQSTAIRLAACRNDEATADRTLKALLSRRPNNAQAIFEMAYLSAYMLNDLPAADSLRDQGRKIALNPQPSEVLTPALKAFQRGDMADVVAQLKQSGNLAHPAKNVLWLIASNALGDDAGYRAALSRLAESGYHTPEAIIGVVANSCWHSQVKSELTAALRTSFVGGIPRAL